VVSHATGLHPVLRPLAAVSCRGRGTLEGGIPSCMKRAYLCTVGIDLVLRMRLAGGPLRPDRAQLLERAKRLLRETDRSIAQIAFECGFSHQEYMTRFFGQLAGTTPPVSCVRRAPSRPGGGRPDGTRIPCRDTRASCRMGCRLPGYPSHDRRHTNVG
jgi:hypothetical protein